MALEVSSDAEFITDNIKVIDPDDVTKKYLLPDPDSLPVDLILLIIILLLKMILLEHQDLDLKDFLM